LPPRCLAGLALALTVGTAPSARADVLPPPEPIQCGPGQVAATDHGGTHCEYKRCGCDNDCPLGMPCVERTETHCDPRGEPCFTNAVKRCSDPSGGPGSVPGRRGGCGCELGAPTSSTVGLALAVLLVLGLARRRPGR